MAESTLHAAQESNLKRKRSPSADYVSSKAAVNDLPDELLLHVLSYLPWVNRLGCLSVCRQWNRIMTSSVALWSSPPAICAGIVELEAKWELLSRLTAGGKVRALKLQIWERYREGGDEKYLERLQASKFKASFPWNTLVEFEYEGVDTSIDDEVWKWLTHCTQLKVLKWQSFFCQTIPPQKGPPAGMYRIKNTQLAACKLETFRFRTNYPIDLDEAYVDLLGSVRQLHLKQGLNWRRVSGILDAAKVTVEELSLSNHQRLIPDEVGVFEMPRLHRYKTRWPWRGDSNTFSRGPKIITKGLTSLIFKQDHMIDWDLVEANRGSLRRLYINTSGERVEDRRLAEELFNMPNLEILELRHGDIHPYEGDNDDPDPRHVWSSFGEMLDNGVTGRAGVNMDAILPKLKRLTFVDINQLDEDHLLDFLAFRKHNGLPDIQQLRILPAKQCAISKAGRSRIRRLVGTLQYDKYDHWCDGETSSGEESSVSTDLKKQWSDTAGCHVEDTSNEDGEDYSDYASSAQDIDIEEVFQFMASSEGMQFHEAAQYLQAAQVFGDVLQFEGNVLEEDDDGEGNDNGDDDDADVSSSGEESEGEDEDEDDEEEQDGSNANGWTDGESV